MNKYYIRINTNDRGSFEHHLSLFDVEYSHLSTDFGKDNSTSLYAVIMDEESALSLKLSFPIIGCINFRFTMDKLCK